VWIKSFAKTIVTVRQPVILSFGPEMNGSWYQYGSGKSSPGSWVSAYKHFHDVLIGAVRHDLKELQIPERAGKLVSFMWQPSAMHKKTHTPAPYWPGKQYVDLVGLDGYYYYSDDTFASIFGKTLKLVRSLTSAPVMIGETAAAPEFNKETWDIDDLFAGVRANHLLGLIWFDENQLDKKYAAGQRKFHQDWHIQDFPSAVATFRKDLAGQGKIASYEMHG
jgi:mannan endo-1,4-beta-mannosidase